MDKLLPFDPKPKDKPFNDFILFYQRYIALAFGLKSTDIIPTEQNRSISEILREIDNLTKKLDK